ncbi:uncharacterized protein [Macrobrachium rosenbergii]|uniref:uncharacterized protein n=1 Tax=Macrobrachium rosenbergii TaxID=79674 RepID=UPI0034D5688F
MAACAAATLPAQVLDLPAHVSSGPTPTPTPSPVDRATTNARKHQVSELFDVAFTRAEALRDDMLTTVDPPPHNPRVLYWRKFFQEVEDECAGVRTAGPAPENGGAWCHSKVHPCHQRGLHCAVEGHDDPHHGSDSRVSGTCSSCQPVGIAAAAGTHCTAAGAPASTVGDIHTKRPQQPVA